MLLRLSKLTGDDHDRRCYFNTSTIVWVGSVAGNPDHTLILLTDGSKTIVEKPVIEVMKALKEHDRSLFI